MDLPRVDRSATTDEVLHTLHVVAERLPAQARALLGHESYGEVARLGPVDFDPVGPRSSG